jgi:signal transduction histidine kinase
MSPRASIPNTEYTENRVIAAIRLVLALSGLLITYIDSTQAPQLLPYTYAVLALYICYSTSIYLLATRHNTLPSPILAWAHWIDVGWYSLLIVLSNGTSSVYFFGFFFAILVAAFRWGFVSGLRVSIGSALLFTIIGLISALIEPDFGLNRFMLRPIYLVALGYMISYWGELEIVFKRRLMLLKEVSTFSNPRFGIERTLGWLLERLRVFFSANDCLLVMTAVESGEYQLHRTDPRDSEAAARAQPIPADLAEQLLSLPPDQAVVYNGRQRFWQRLLPDSGNQRMAQYLVNNQSLITTLAAQLDANALLTVPIHYRSDLHGRLFVLKRGGRFRASDADFLLQVVEQVTPVIDNIRLVDRLASDAAEEERQKIARDLHDSVIQPYIGLQMGIAAVRQKVAAGQANISGELDKLIDLTGEGIADLRGYVHGLRGSGGRESNLVPSVKRFAAKFAAATGIKVQIEANPDMHFNDRLAAEIFQMVAEGLSNIRRHTQATSANIALSRHSDHLILRIENDSWEATGSHSFKPRSLSERAAALGGRAQVVQDNGKTSAVVIEIPL